VDFRAGRGLDGWGASSVGARPRSTPAPRPRPAAEAVAEIDLDEAYHGTTRLIDVEGKRLEVKIPPGADTGTRIRLTGKAPGGGDLHVVVKQSTDPVFTRKGADLERELPITLAEALLGAEVPVRSPKGRVLLTIPARMSSKVGPPVGRRPRPGPPPPTGSEAPAKKALKKSLKSLSPEVWNS
jgi:curved DNA-binding protein